MAKIKPLTVNGIILKAPKTFDPTYKDIDSSNSYTSDRGILVRDMIRANHHTFEVSWQSITGDELKVILQAISGKASFTLRYWDVYSKGYKEGKFYSSDRQVTTNEMGLKDDETSSFNLSCELIEF